MEVTVLPQWLGKRSFSHTAHAVMSARGPLLGKLEVVVSSLMCSP